MRSRRLQTEHIRNYSASIRSRIDNRTLLEHRLSPLDASSRLGRRASTTAALALRRSSALLQPRSSCIAAMSTPLAVPISLVSIGFQDTWGKEFLKWGAVEQWHVVDVRSLHRDPADIVSHHETGDSPNVQVAVIGQDGFPGLVSQIVETALKGASRIAIACNKGRHRSIVVARMVEDILNQLPVSSPVGPARLTAKHFIMSSVANQASFRRITDDIMAWGEAPWWMPSTTGLLPWESRWAHATAMSSRLSAQNWRAVAEWVDLLVLSGGEASISVLLPHVSMIDPAPAAPPAASGAASSSVVASAVASSAAQPEYGWLAGPTPPAEPPSASQLARGRADIAPEEEWDDEEQVTAVRSRRRACSVHRGTKISPRKRFSSIACQTDPHEPAAKRHPKWVSFDRRPEVWADVLKDIGVDATAGQDLFLLATHSDGGWQAANAIMAKLVKKKRDGEDFRNVSGFVHRCVLNARNELGRESGSSSSRAEWSNASTSKWGASSWK